MGELVSEIMVSLGGCIIFTVILELAEYGMI
jgi:hypothetical protein